MPFPRTEWHRVDRVKSGGEDGRQALGELAAIYALPLLGFARKEFPGRADEDYEDMLQYFFCQCLQKQTVTHADEEKGTLRSFLMTCFKRSVFNRDRAEGAQKRSPGSRLLSLDALVEQNGDTAEPRMGESPERAFDRLYFEIMLKRAVDHATEVWQKNDQNVRLKVFVCRAIENVSFEDLVRELDLDSVQTARKIYRSARTDFREVLRDLLAGGAASGSTLEIESQAEAEYVVSTMLCE